jgi:hypothetical protein
MSRKAIVIGLAVAAVAVVGAAAFSLGLWRAVGASSISLAGWIAMILGILASLAVGVGLMALAFFSSRRGYDEIDRE